MSPQPISVLLVDDHPLVRDGVRMRLQATAHIRVAGEASCVNQAVAMAEDLQPDIVLTDIRMPDGSGIQLAAIFAQRFPQVRVLVLSMHCDPEFVRRAVELGVCGYVLKDAPAQQLVEAIDAVQAGQRYFSPALRAFAGQAEQADPPGRTPRGLTQRESDVLALLAQGWSNKEIAERLGASIRTVETHRLHLRRKLHIEGRAALVKYAVDHADLSMQPPEGTDRGVEP